MTCVRSIGCVLVAVGLAGIGVSRPASAQTAAGGDRVSPPAAAAQLPKDVYPDSLNRLPLIKESDLDEEGKKALMAIGEDFKAATESGPRSIRMYSPNVAEYMTTGNQYLRYKSGLDGKVRELTIMSAARAMDQQYEWAAHVRDGLKAGVPQELIDCIKLGTPIPANAGAKEAAVIQLGREALYGDHQVRPETFARLLQLFGKRGTVDLVSLMGHYTATAILLNTFDQHLKPGDQPQLKPLPEGWRGKSTK